MQARYPGIFVVVRDPPGRVEDHLVGAGLLVGKTMKTGTDANVKNPFGSLRLRATR